MNFTVCGPSGFIGHALVNFLYSNGHSVKIICRNKNSLDPFLRQLDSLEYRPEKKSIDLLADFLSGTDVLINCAGALEGRSQMHSAHILLVKSLIESALKSRVARFVQLSSVGVYGPPRTNIVLESHPLFPVNEYEISKLASESLLMEAIKRGLEVTILRPSNVFGDLMSNYSLTYLIKVIKIRFFFYIGNRSSIMNYVHVDNVVHAIVLCSSHPAARNQIFNISQHLSMDEFVSNVCKTCSIKSNFYTIPFWMAFFLSKLELIYPSFPLTSNRISAMTNKSQYSCKKIEDLLGYRPIISIDDGIEKVVSYWLKTKRI